MLSIYSRVTEKFSPVSPGFYMTITMYLDIKLIVNDCPLYILVIKIGCTELSDLTGGS